MIKKLWILPLSILVTYFLLYSGSMVFVTLPAQARINETQVNATPTNTPYSLMTDWYTPIKTPVPTCPPCFYIPLGTLTPTPAPVATATPIQYFYTTTKVANIYNNNGFIMERWEAGHIFQTGDWIKNGRLYLGPTLQNRWIAVTDYVRMQ